ncbi:MAG: hypothetical protein LQ352_001330 [Teloschistes flavicans]|nr:MAG: hypothetical protein LQ352_001330 [Teloschistes flavicans]
MDIAQGTEEDSRTLARQVLLLAVASIHTTTIATIQMLYDLGARPEYIQPIQDKILQALNDEAKEEEKDGWQKSALDKMLILDSFRKESQRFAPQTLYSNNLSFGYGKYACPGRFLASYEIKLIVAMLLVQFDIGFPEGKGRPGSMMYSDSVFPDPKGGLILKERKKV